MYKLVDRSVKYLLLRVLASNHFHATTNVVVIEQLVKTEREAGLIFARLQEDNDYVVKKGSICYGNKYEAHLYQIELEKGTVTEVEIPEIIFSWRMKEDAK